MRRMAIVAPLLLWMGVLPLHAAVHAWSTTGPFGGPITGLAIDPANPARLWAVSFNGGVFRSVDAGAHWAPTIGGLGDLTVNAIAVDPIHTSTLLVGTQEGIFRSTDGGSHWTAGNSGLMDGADIRAIAFDPSNDQRVLAGESSHGVYESADGGSSWTLASVGMGPDFFVTSVAIDPNHPATAFAGTYNGHLYRTTDGAATWQTLQNGLPAHINYPSLLADRTTPSRVFAGTGTGVYVSTNDGDSWDATAGTSGEIYGFAPEGAQTLYAVSLQDGVFRSTDGGRHWTSANAGLPTSGLDAIAADATHPGTVYAGGNEVFKSSDGAAHWGLSQAGLASQSVTSIALGGSPLRIYAGTYGNGVFRSIDGGKTWLAPSESGELFVAGLALDPTNPAAVYAAAYEAMCQTSADGGIHWQSSSAGLAGHWFYGVVAAGSPGTLYIGGDPSSADAADGGVFVSHNHGASWQPANSGLTDRSVRALAADPANPLVLYAGTAAGVFRTDDGANGWMPANAGLPADQVVALAVDPLSHRTLYAGFYGSGVFRTTDGGAHWAAVNTGLADRAVQSLSTSRTTEGLLYVATYGGGIFWSVDGGGHWDPLNAGLSNLQAAAVLSDDDRARVLAGLWGSSVQELDLVAVRGPIIPGSPPRPKKTKRPTP